MLALRILTLPIAMTVFIGLFVAATKAPHAVETTSIAICVGLPIVLIVVTMIRLARR